MQTPETQLGKSDVVFNISNNHEKIGELRISKGAPVWFPAKAKKGFRLSWSRFGELMEQHGKPDAYR